MKNWQHLCPIGSHKILSAVTPDKAVKPNNAVNTWGLRVLPPCWAAWLNSLWEAV